MENFVYIGICVGYNDSHPLAIKVGSSKNPDGRIASFKRYYINGKSFSLLEKYGLKNRADAYAFERLLQNVCSQTMPRIEYSELFGGSAVDLARIKESGDKIHKVLKEVGL